MAGGMIDGLGQREAVGNPGAHGAGPGLGLPRVSNRRGSG